MTVAVRRPVAEDRELAEEVAGAERPHLDAVDRDGRAAVAEHEELVARRTLAREPDAGTDVLKLEPRRDRRPLLGLECVEERDPAEVVHGREGHRR